MRQKWVVILYVTIGIQLLVGSVLSGCNTFRGNSREGTFTDSVFSPDQEDAKDRLQEIVREYIQIEQGVADQHSAPVVRRSPYYFKEYVMFPDGEKEFSILFREIDSRIRPLMAEVQINKVRYSTRMHRKRNRAAVDMDFMRDTGMEVLVFELRSGRWLRTGTIFDAGKTEEYINGEWMPRREETQRIVPSEERQGWFKRTWLRIRGEG